MRFARRDRYLGRDPVEPAIDCPCPYSDPTNALLWMLLQETRRTNILLSQIISEAMQDGEPDLRTLDDAEPNDAQASAQ